MKTILHVIPSLEVGGAERQLSYLAPELVSMGHRVHVAYSKESSGRPELPYVTLHKLTSQNNYDPRLIWELVRYIRRIKPDIIHTWILQMDIIGGIAAKLSGTPWVLREPSSAMAYLPTWKNHLRARIASSARAIVSNSQGGDAYWSNQIPESCRYIVRNGLPIAQIDGVSAALPQGLPEPGAPIVLSVGRLTFDRSGNKNLKIWLEALARIKRKKAVFGILCGEGPQRAELEAAIHSLGLDGDVRLTGHLPAPAVWALMKRASVFVSLSEFEGCPNTVMEAMACRCPLVVSNIPAHREILDEGCAGFVDPSDVGQVADMIVETLSNRESALDRARMARHRSTAWSITEMARGFERVYESLVQPLGSSRKALPAHRLP